MSHSAEITAVVREFKTLAKANGWTNKEIEDTIFDQLGEDPIDVLKHLGNIINDLSGGRDELDELKDLDIEDLEDDNDILDMGDLEDEDDDWTDEDTEDRTFSIKMPESIDDIDPIEGDDDVAIDRTLDDDFYPYDPDRDNRDTDDFDDIDTDDLSDKEIKKINDDERIF